MLSRHETAKPDTDAYSSLVEGQKSRSSAAGSWGPWAGRPPSRIVQQIGDDGNRNVAQPESWRILVWSGTAASIHGILDAKTTLAFGDRPAPSQPML